MRRRYTGIPQQIIRWFSIIFGLYFLLFVAGIFDRLGWYIYPPSHDALLVGFLLAYTFLMIPASKRSSKDKLPWYDVIFIVLSLVPTFYMMINAMNIAEGTVVRTEHIVLGLMMAIAVLEAVRRAVHWSLALIGLVFFVYPLIADFMPGFLMRPNVPLDRLLEVMYLYPSGMFGTTVHMFATLIVTFLIFGAFLNNSGAGAAFINLALAIAGRFRGGPAKVAVLGSFLFGLASGSVNADVATVGSITIPMMKKAGYSPTFSGAVQAVASMGSPLSPPIMGATVFVMMSFLGTTYVEMMIALTIPTFIYYAGLFFMVDQEAVKLQLKGLPKDQIPPFWKSLKGSWVAVVPIIFLVFFLMVLHYSPMTSAIYSIIAILICTAFDPKTRMGPKKLADTMSEYPNSFPAIGSACVVAGLLLGAFNVTGLGLTIANELVVAAGGNVLILALLVTFVCFLMGTAMSGIAVYMVVAIFIAPALVQAGVVPLAAHMFVYWMAHTSLITPPTGGAFMIAGTIAGAPLMRTGWTACRLAISVYLMALVWIWDPATLMVGSASGIIIATICIMIAVVLASSSFTGVLLKRAGIVERILFMAGAILIVFPPLTYKLIAIAIIALPVLQQMIKFRFLPGPKTTSISTG